MNIGMFWKRELSVPKIEFPHWTALLNYQKPKTFCFSFHMQWWYNNTFKNVLWRCWRLRREWWSTLCECFNDLTFLAVNVYKILFASNSLAGLRFLLPLFTLRFISSNDITLWKYIPEEDSIKQIGVPRSWGRMMLCTCVEEGI